MENKKAFFFKDINKNNKEAMIMFLKNHFRYNTTNSWNHSTSYANNMKIYNLPFTEEQKNQLYNMLSIDIDIAFNNIQLLLGEFAKRYNYKYQAGFNGRNGGYLVLYKGEEKDNQVTIFPNQNIDMEEDFSKWKIKDIRKRVQLIQDFDKLCDNILKEATYIADNYEIQKVPIITMKTVLVPKSK